MKISIFLVVTVIASIASLHAMHNAHFYIKASLLPSKRLQTTTSIQIIARSKKEAFEHLESIIDGDKFITSVIQLAEHRDLDTEFEHLAKKRK